MTLHNCRQAGSLPAFKRKKGRGRQNVKEQRREEKKKKSKPNNSFFSVCEPHIYSSFTTPLPMKSEKMQWVSPTRCPAFWQPIVGGMPQRPLQCEPMYHSMCPWLMQHLTSIAVLHIVSTEIPAVLFFPLAVTKGQTVLHNASPCTASPVTSAKAACGCSSLQLPAALPSRLV